MIGNRELFILHEGTRAAFEQLHDTHKHQENHQDLEKGLRHLLADDALDLETRVRMAYSLGAVTLRVMFAGEAFADVPSDRLATMMRLVVTDILKSG
ncbi:MAG TPA: hypothetical protein VHT30_02775 [Acidimicrobiales bacterium]|jgi:hypothetical protein|nr:hypothetical protein [Acidimicrobiales bacterium]